MINLFIHGDIANKLAYNIYRYIINNHTFYIYNRNIINIKSMVIDYISIYIIFGKKLLLLVIIDLLEQIFVHLKRLVLLIIIYKLIKKVNLKL